MCEVTVVMPIYNSENYLQDSIRSVLNQTFSNFELLLINDGSTDKSGKICTDFSQQDKRIVVIDKKNEGPSAARNLGIDKAKGKYLCFIDSDDEYDQNYLKKMLGYVGIYDFIACGIQSFNDNGKSTLSKGIICESIKQIHQNLITIIETSILNSPINKLYNVQLLKSNQFKFDESMDVGEDYHFNMNVLMHCQSFISIPDMLYFYKTRMNSITSSYKENIIETRKKNIDLTESALKKAHIESDLVSKMKLKLIYVYLIQIKSSQLKISSKEIKNNIYQPYFNSLQISSGISYYIMLLVYRTHNLFFINLLVAFMLMLKSKGQRIKGGSM